MPSLPLKFFVLLGSVVYAGSSAELIIKTAILRLMSKDGNFAGLVLPAISGMDISVKLAVLQSTANVRLGEKRSEPLKKYAIALKSAFDDRNLLVHNAIEAGRNDEEIIVSYLKLKRSGRFPNPEYWTLDQVQRVKTRLFKYPKLIMEFLDEEKIPKLSPPRSSCVKPKPHPRPQSDDQT